MPRNLNGRLATIERIISRRHCTPIIDAEGLSESESTLVLCVAETELRRLGYPGQLIQFRNFNGAWHGASFQFTDELYDAAVKEAASWEIPLDLATVREMFAEVGRPDPLAEAFTFTLRN